jgi:hypothetical protein
MSGLGSGSTRHIFSVVMYKVESKPCNFSTAHDERVRTARSGPIDNLDFWLSSASVCDEFIGVEARHRARHQSGNIRHDREG